MSIATYCVLFLTGLSLFSGDISNAQAQETRINTDEFVEKLSIDQAVSLAMENNLELKSLREFLGVARGQFIGAKTFQNNPNLDLVFFNANPTEISGSRSEFSLGLSQEFEIGGQRGHRKQVAQFTIEKVKFEIARLQRVLKADTEETFYQILLQQKRLEFADRVISLTEDLVAITSGKFSSGYAPQYDVNFAKLELQKSVMEKASVESRLEVARYELNNLMGRSWQLELTAVGELFKQDLTSELEKLKSYAINNRSDLKALQFEQQAALSRTDLAIALRRPNLKLSLLYDREFDKNSLGAMISLPFNLFNRNQGDIASSIANQKTSEMRSAFLKTLIEKEVAASYSEAILASKEVQILEENMLGLAKKNMNLLQQAYSRGEIEIIELIAAQRAFIDTETAYLEALFNINVAMVKLEKVVGGKI